MKEWFKKQITELTALIGFAICLSVYFTSDTVIFVIGLLLIAIDDVKANKFKDWVRPTLDRWIDWIYGDA